MFDYCIKKNLNFSDKTIPNSHLVTIYAQGTEKLFQN